MSITPLRFRKTFAAARPLPPFRLVTVLAGLLAASGFAGCSHDWDAYDPRLGDTGGAGGTTSAGGASTTSTTSTGGTSSTTSTGGATGGGGAGGATGGGGAGGATGGGGAGGATGGGGSGGATGGGGSGGGGGGGPTRCGGTSALTDDFSGEPLDLWDISDWGGATANQIAGELVITLPPNNPGSAGYDLRSEYAYDFHNDAVSVEVVAAADPASGASAGLSIGPTGEDYFEMYHEDGTLVMAYHLADVHTGLKTTPYDPVMHRWFRIREDAGQVIFDTSPDGVAWSVQTMASTAGLFPLDLVYMSIGGYTPANVASPGEVRFAKLNGGGVPTQKYCPTGSITDDFNDGLESAEWARSYEDVPGMLAEESGQLVIHLLPDATGGASLSSARAFDLTGSSLVVEVPLPPDPAVPAGFSVELNGPGNDSPTDNDVEMNLSDGQLQFTIVNAGNSTDIGSVLYNPVMHRWLRMREDANTLFWETSPDGNSWTIQLQLSPVPVPIDIMEIEISGGTHGLHMSPGEIHVDNVNLPPP